MRRYPKLTTQDRVQANRLLADLEEMAWEATNAGQKWLQYADNNERRKLYELVGKITSQVRAVRRRLGIDKWEDKH